MYMFYFKFNAYASSLQTGTPTLGATPKILAPIVILKFLNDVLDGLLSQHIFSTKFLGATSKTYNVVWRKKIDEAL